MPTTPVLDLTATTTRPLVRIDGQDYTLRSLHDLDLPSVATMERLGPRIAALLGLETPTPAQTTQLSTLLDQVCRIGLDAPAAVQQALGDVNRLLIFRIFSETMLRETLPLLAFRDAVTALPGAPATTYRPDSGQKSKRGKPRRRR